MNDIEVTEEMRRAVALERCRMVGHDFGVVVGFGGQPHSIICHLCDESWQVTPK